MTSSVTINPVSGAVEGQPFTVSGTVSIAPSLSYDDDGDTGPHPPPPGSTVPNASSAFAIAHPALPAGQHHTVVSEAGSGASGAVSYTVSASAKHSWAFVGPGSGSFKAADGVTYSVDAQGNALANGAKIAGGGGTRAMALLGGQAYGEDAGNSGWYLWNGSTWARAALSPAAAEVKDGDGFLFLPSSLVATLTSVGGQIAFNGNTDAITKGVALLAPLASAGPACQQNAAGEWYSGGPGAWAGPLPGDPRKAPVSSGLNVINGQLTLNGQPYAGRGINEYCQPQDPGGNDNGLHQWGAQATLNLFRKLAFLRLNTATYPSPQSIAPIVQALTDGGVLVEIEDHNYPGVLTGAALQKSAAWYASMAQFFEPNQMVCFGLQNEPGGNNGDMVDVANMLTTLYQALRNAGYTRTIFICAGGGWNMQAAALKSAIAAMSNRAWDLHYYNNPGEADPNKVKQALQAWINSALACASIPYAVLEYGPASGANGNNWDPNGWLAVEAVQALDVLCAAWAYTSGDSSFPLLLTDGDGNPAGGLSSNYGVPIEQFIAAG